MQLINKKYLREQPNRGDVFVKVTEDDFSFTSAAVLQYDLEAGKYMHFLNDGKVWCFIINNDPEGFMICSDGSKNNNAKVCSRPLIRLFQKTTQKMLGSRFYLQDTDQTHDGHKMVQILADKSIEEIMKHNGQHQSNHSSYKFAK